MTMHWQATAKQVSYFKALTGRSLPRGCGKSQASALINAAKNGSIETKKRLVRVYQQRMHAPTHRDHGKISWAVDLDYAFQTSFDTQEMAEAYARKMLGQFPLEVDTLHIRELCFD